MIVRGSNLVAIAPLDLLGAERVSASMAPSTRRGSLCVAGCRT
jgi:hypothetical protein